MTGQTDKPKNFGPFELLQRLGRGNTAVVFKARHRTTDRIVAIKIAPPLLSLDRSNFERFRREFTIVQHLSHPNLVQVLELGEERQCPYLVQEFVDGQSLDKRLQEGPLPLAEGVDVILQVAEGLRILHQNDFLHRDVKPGNIILDSNGTVKLGDFGLLKTMSTESGITRTRQSMGTIEFGAPEQFEDARHADVRCDIYSLTATFYSAVTGLFPFGSGSIRRVLMRKLFDKFIPLHWLLSSAPVALDELVSRCLQADRNRRPPTIDAFIESMTAVRDHLAKHSAGAGETPSQILSRIKGGAERRTAARISVKVPAAFVPFQENQRHSFQATILDISHGGMCIHANSLAPLNTILEVTASDTGLSYVAQVRWAKTLSNDTYVLGCSFVSPPKQHEIESISPLLTVE